MSTLPHSLKSTLDQSNWTLFLDRDGVINKKIPDDYIKNWAEFEFLPGVLEALSIFNPLFKNIFIVTNQQGIGKGLMLPETLDNIHKEMLSRVKEQGGRIDKIFYCPDLANTGSLYRKPNIGMALQARKEFPGVNLKNAIIAGDSLSDMKFGRKAGMKTVLISAKTDLARDNFRIIDYHYPDLITFARTLTNS